MNTPTMLKAVFSPTGSTRKIADAIAPGAQTIDLLHDVPEQNVHAGTPLLAVVPVYAGRVPAVALERLAALRGCNGPAIAVVVYGNRAYDDALAELKAALTAGGFRVIAAAAFIAEHSIVRSIAAGRPDAQDAPALSRFAQEVAVKLLRPAEEQTCVEVPGNPTPGERKSMPATPVTGDTCGGCGRCVRECPVNAIPASDPRSTDASRCILCMRCISVCPRRARTLPAPLVAGFTQRLQAVASAPKEPELFL